MVYVDNFAFEGEVSPIVIVAMLLAVTVAVGAAWGRRGWVAAAVAWACVPVAHLVKHVLGLADTLHPNTYASILLLAAFTLLVAILGTGLGVSIGGRRPGVTSPAVTPPPSKRTPRRT